MPLTVSRKEAVEDGEGGGPAPLQSLFVGETGADELDNVGRESDSSPLAPRLPRLRTSQVKVLPSPCLHSAQDSLVHLGAAQLRRHSLHGETALRDDRQRPPPSTICGDLAEAASRFSAG